ncbi:MAG: lipopolysaccharide core heptose(I) kinase RfaP [Oxalobacter sp.]
MYILKEPFLTRWQGKDPFEEVEKITGDVARQVETRRTLRFEMDGQGFYLKLHHGTELVEVMKSLIRLRLPVLGADREWNAIHRLAEHGVDTMEGVAYGMKGGNPLARTSFIITKDLAPATHLTGYFWNERPSCHVKRLIVKRVAQMVRGMHGCGVNHRDCYLVHFLISMPFDAQHGTEEDLKISLIDLHRAQIRDKVPTRWRDKDLIGLLFSARELEDISVRDIYRFMKEYFQKPLREILRAESALIGSARKRIARMERHQENLKRKRQL